MASGRLSEWRERRDDRRDSALAAREAAALAARQADWDESRSDLKGMIALAQSGGFPSDYFARSAIVLGPEENVLGVFRPIALVQPRVGSSTTVTNFGGFSYRLTKNTRVRAGQAVSTHTPGADEAKAIDEGVVVITDQRVYFQGNLRNYEWQLRKVKGVINNSDQPWTSIAVSGRERVAGLRYSWADAVGFRFRLEWALGLNRGNLAPLVASLQRELTALGPRPESGVPAATITTTEPAAGLFDEIADGIERGDFTNG